MTDEQELKTLRVAGHIKLLTWLGKKFDPRLLIIYWNMSNSGNSSVFKALERLQKSSKQELDTQEALYLLEFIFPNDDHSVQEWLKSPNKELDGQIPQEVLEKDPTEVINYLRAYVRG